MRSSNFGMKVPQAYMGGFFDNLLESAEKAVNKTLDNTLTSVEQQGAAYLQKEQQKLIAAGINLVDGQVNKVVPDSLTQEQQKEYLAKMGLGLTQGALTGASGEIDKLKKYGVIVGGVIVVAMLGMLALNISAVRGAKAQ